MPQRSGTVEYLLRVEAADLAAHKVFHTDVFRDFAAGKCHNIVCRYGLAQGFARLIPSKRETIHIYCL